MAVTSIELSIELARGELLNARCNDEYSPIHKAVEALLEAVEELAKAASTNASRTQGLP